MKLRNNPEYSKATVAATEETLKIGLVSHLKTSFFSSSQRYLYSPSWDG